LIPSEAADEARTSTGDRDDEADEAAEKADCATWARRVESAAAAWA
jgi:hypothetical protein